MTTGPCNLVMLNIAIHFISQFHVNTFIIQHRFPISGHVLRHSLKSLIVIQFQHVLPKPSNICQCLLFNTLIELANVLFV